MAPVYFSFDESTLDSAARAALVDDRACLTERGVTSVMVTGMTDPRGTEEYNLALGSRRAEAVRGHLRRLGVERRSISTRSVGEESAIGTEESGWSRDRRAEIAPR
jgi:peptidoglycan-associated lipoprotein